MGRYDDDEPPFMVADCVSVHETDRALLVERPNGAKSWVPKSVIDWMSEVKEPGDEGMLCVAAWWARKVGWED